MPSILVFIEHTQGEVKKASLAGITFAQQVAAKSGEALHLVLVGSGSAKGAATLTGYGAAKIYTAEHTALKDYSNEGHCEAVSAAAKGCGASLVCGTSSSTVKDFLPRVAVRLNAGMASDVMAVVNASTFKRPMWAGNVIATVEISTPVRVCSVRGTEFDPPKSSGGASPLEALALNLDANAFKSKFVSVKTMKSERPDLATADRVVSGGRGVKGAEGFKVIEQLADAMGAAVGASRAVCDAGWVPNDYQVGQTGKVVAPDLYVAVGISGAIQHLAGMKGSKVIVAINKDPEAPIFQVADYGLVADLFVAVPELILALKK